MADETTKSQSLKMLCTGFGLGVANDLHPQGKFNYLQNVRVLKEGIIEARPRIETYLTLNPDPQAVAHTIRTILNKSNGTFNHIVGAGTKIFSGNQPAVVNQIDSGYSGKALFTVDFRPEQSIEAYLYIADELKMSKISVSNVLKDIGITVPFNPPTWQALGPQRKIIDKIVSGSEASWTGAGAAATPPILTNRINTTTTACLWDSSLPGFVSVVPANSANLLVGSIITNGGVDYIVEEVNPATLKTGIATITKISYDSGTTGYCTIVLSISSAEIQRNSVLLLNGTEYVKVTDVTRDSNNIPSVRVITISNHLVGETVSGIDAFRVYTAVNFAAASQIFNDAIRTTISAAGIGTLTRTFNVDLLNTGVKPLTLDDNFHISLLADPAAFSEIQIQLDASTGTFVENYFYFPISPNFFTASVKQTTPTLSVLQQSLQREQLLSAAGKIYSERYKDPGSPIYDPMVTFNDFYAAYLQEQRFNGLASDAGGNSTESATGINQWSELNIKLSDFIKVGSDTTKTLKDIKAIRISVNATSVTGFQIDSLWVGGAGSLDTTTEGFLPYNYVWRVRDPSTRVPSNWSPPLRAGIRLTRSGVTLTFPEAAASYPSTYQLDIARFGGSLSDFRIIGTVKNDGSSFTDLTSDRLAADNPLAGRFSLQGATDAVFDFYKPFAFLDTPKKGTCNVIGTKLTIISGDSLSLTYPRGVAIIVAGQVNSFYTRPSSTTTVDLETDMGSLSGVTFEIPEPLLTGQPLPVIFGPAGEGNLAAFIFGLGDKNAAGTLYWLDGNSPDTQSDINYLEITSPSEPLVVGVIYDGYPFIWTTQRSFMLQPSVDAQGNFAFAARENANSRGVFHRNSICVNAAYIYFLSENADGIYRVQGNGNPECITKDLWKNFFRNNGNEPVPTTLVNGQIIYPPDFTKPNEIRFFSTQDYIFFRFVNTNNEQVALVFSVAMNDFVSLDRYVGTGNVNAFYREELENERNILFATDGHTISRYGTATGWETSTECIIIPYAFDGGDSRSVKEFKEHMVEAINGVGGYKYTLFWNNGVLGSDGFQFPPDPIFVLGDNTGKRVQQILALEGDQEFGPMARNYTPVYQWIIEAGAKFYEDKIYFVPKGDVVDNRSGDVEDGGDLGNKLWQGVIIQGDTFNVDKTLVYRDDTNATRATLVINHYGEETKSYAFDSPFISHTIKRTSNDGVDWILNKEVYVFDREPEEAKVWEGEFNTHDLTGLILMKRMAVAYRSLDYVLIDLTLDQTVNQVYVLPPTSQSYSKVFFYVNPAKWKACRYRFTSNQDFMLYKKDCEVWMKSLSSNTPFGRFNPFGGPSRVTEILI